MSDLGFWPRFLLAVLATWRVTHLLAKEDGPADLVLRLRRAAGPILDCFHCVSVWVAAPAALVVAQKPVDIVIAWLALSGAACLIERASGEPVVIEKLQGDPNHGMLWPETRPGDQPAVAAGYTRHYGGVDRNPEP